VNLLISLAYISKLQVRNIIHQWSFLRLEAIPTHEVIIRFSQLFFINTQTCFKGVSINS